MASKELEELKEACRTCEAGDPCWACGVRERLNELEKGQRGPI